jgi:probable HAF family extracellular repeat protein
MNRKIITCRSKIFFGVLLFGVLSCVQASYRIVEITKEETLDTRYTIFAGNQYLNDKGQITGFSVKYTENKLFNYGSRVFIWQRNRVRSLKTLGTDALGYSENLPSGINNNGQVVGTSHDYDKYGVDQGQRAVYWLNGEIVNLGNEAKKSGFVNSTGVAINDSGQMAGTGISYENVQDKGTRPILWTRGKAKNLGVLSVNADGYNVNTVTGMNAAGHVIGWDGNFKSFLWDGFALQELIPLNFDLFSFANAINNKDQIVGRGDDINGSFSVLWKNGLIQSLGSLDPNPDAFPINEAIAINELEQIIGYEFLPVGLHAYLWTEGKLTDLGVLGIDEFGTESSFANAVNNKGQVVGFSSYSESGLPKGNHAFIYQNNTMVDLNILLPLGSDWLLENALAINDNGQITVYGTYSKGTQSYKGYALLMPM